MARSLIRITTAMVLVFCTFTMVQVQTQEFVRDPCLNFLCQNDGICTAPADAPYCRCPEGFSGTRCEIVIGDPPDHPGTCPAVEPGGQGICGGVICDCDDECDEDEKCCDSACGGKLCTKVVVVLTDPCWNFVCQNDGICTAPADAPYCKCLPGFSGTHCEIVDDDSPDHPGTCPAVEPGDLGTCGGVICDCDDECAEDEKCCDSACDSKMCTKVVVEHQPQASCATVRCNAETACRMVLICEDEDCQLGPRCISTALLGPARDSVCRRHGYLEVLLVLDDSSVADYPRYNQLTCKGPWATRDCPTGYVCVDDAAGGSACCTGKPDPIIEKPGTCPTGSLSVCGGTFCEVDNNCPGEQKCCRRKGCGNLCTDPDIELSGGCDMECPRGQTCVYRTPKCPPGMACIQAFLPTCVPDDCVHCDFNEICQEVLPNKFGCVPEPKDLCGGCAIGEVCIDTGKRCFAPPCDGVYQCVRDNECGGCREGEVCIDTGKRCFAPPCDGVYQCVPDDPCGGCPEGEVCVDTGIVCVTTPCPTNVCVPDNKCGGCPPRQRCEEVYPPCAPPPDCDALRAIDPQAQCIIPDCKPVHICVDDNSPDPDPDPEPEPSLCPLRCAYNQKCEYVALPCLLGLGTTCYRPQCIPTVPVPAPCPKPKGLLSVVQCILHKLLFPVCQSDLDCRGSSQRCCVADCGRKSCVAAP